MAIAPASPVLPSANPADLGLDPRRLEDLYALIESHMAAGRYPGVQIAVARHGRLAALRSFGDARVEPTRVPATDDTLWLLYSQTKVILTAVIWQLVDRGALSFADRVADHLPDFARGGKGEITVFQLLTHQAGFPNAVVPATVWGDHALLRDAVCRFELEWAPGSRIQYHGATAHWTAAVLIEALTGRDYRDVVRSELLDPLGLTDIMLGVPSRAQARCADMHRADGGQLVLLHENNSALFRAAGVPGGGGYATAAALTAFYQMLLAGGVLNGVRVLSRRVIAYATTNHTDERVDDYNRMPMHRGIGPHVRGETPTIRGLGTIASPATFGHGGVGSSYSWGDPTSGVSFTYLTNCRSDEPWHGQRLDHVSNIVHASIVED
jgi:CubicO group peptidase (beta-lactamase class C family)